MFDKFGLMNCEELNRAAAAQLKEGDIDALMELAKENGIDEMDTEDYIDGVCDELASPLMAASGKLSVEIEHLKLKGVVKDWAECLLGMMTDDEELCLAVRKTDKTLTEFLGKALKVAFDTKEQLDDSIVKAAGLRPPVYLGIPSTSDIKKLAKEYYKG